MTISSLQDLNNYALTPITYNDVRPAAVFFDRGATVPQSLTISENNTFVFPWGINIEDITQFDVALVEYEIDLSNFTTPVSVNWDSLPAHVTVNRVNNIWTVSGIRNRQDWLFVRQARVQPPFGFSGLITHTGTISFFANSAAQTRTEAAWTVSLTVLEIEYFSAAPPLTYTANILLEDISTTSIIADPDEFNPVWTLRISASDKTIISEIFADTGTWNNTTKEFVISGDSTVVNLALSTLDLQFARKAVDFQLNFVLANNFTSQIETQVQLFDSRDFISDVAVASTTSLIPKKFTGGVVTLVSSAGFNLPEGKRFRDPTPTTLPSSVVALINAGILFIVDIEDMPSTTALAAQPLRIKQLEADFTVTTGQTTNIIRIRNPEEIDYSVEASTNIIPYVHQDGMVFTFDNSIFDTTDIQISLSGTNSTTIDWMDGAGNILTSSVADNDYETEIGLFLSGEVDYNVKKPSSTNTAMETVAYPGSFNGYVTAIIKGDATGRLLISGGRKKIIEVANWGTTNTTSMFGTFNQCSNLKTVPNYRWPTTVYTCQDMFAECTNLNCDLDTWNTSNVRAMRGMFRQAIQFNGDITTWDTSNVSTFRGMFNLAVNFNQPIGSWDTTGIEHFFTNGIATVPEGALVSMFNGISASPTVFNQDISTWDTTNARSFIAMFDNSLFNQPLNSWNTSNVTRMDQMFKDGVFNQPLNLWNTSNVTNMFEMFNNNAVFDQDISGWCVELIPSKPSGFDSNTNPNWIEAEKPNWGAPC